MSLARRTRLALLALLPFVAACGDDDEPCTGSTCPITYGGLTVVNGARGFDAVSVLLNGNVNSPRLASGTATSGFVLPGEYVLDVAPVGQLRADSQVVTIGVVAGEPVTAIVTDGPAVNQLFLTLLDAAGPALTNGRTNLRVANAAGAYQSVDFLVTPPGGTETALAPALAFRAGSEFTEGNPGTWTVRVTPAGNAAQTLAQTTIDLAANQRASVVLVLARTTAAPTLVAARERF